ncbi:MAG: Uma2 family endonuclease, partial [Campylobacterota bacterium]|nr:Uma2 family endonuclease [Campylobacterota bacterium]
GVDMGSLKVNDIPRYTYEDYKLWENEWELIEGYPYAMAPAPMIKHQSISNKIGWVLQDAFEDCKRCQALLPVDWKISENTIVQPDNSVICHKPKNKAYLSKAPKIIFEILSKSTAKKDMGIKYDLYEGEGVKYYIIVNPDDEIAKVYQLQDGKYIKVCDATDEKIDFKIEECDISISFDFSKIWG